MKCAFFDVDGTLFDGSLGLELGKFLVSKGYIDKSMLKVADVVSKKYKAREIDYYELVDEMVELFAESIKGKDIEEFKAYANEAFPLLQGKVFPFAKDLVAACKKHGYVTVILSISPVVILEPLTKYLEADFTLGSELKIDFEKNVYTGELATVVHKSTGKYDAIKSFIKENKVNLEESIMFGDTVQDIPLFEKVGKPICIRPSKELIDYAKNKNWAIVDKDIIKKVEEII